jgi:hypothetical protein
MHDCRFASRQHFIIAFALEPTSSLSRRSLDLRCRTLSPLLTRDATSRLPTRRLAGRLRLLCLPCTLSRSLLLLPFLDGGLSGSGTGLWALGASLLDHVEGCPHDGALVLDRAAGALLGHFLQSAMCQYGVSILGLVLRHEPRGGGGA